MEFMCVLSVHGALAYYQVVQLGAAAYEATLKSGSERRDLPACVSIWRTAEGWLTEPNEPAVSQALVHALEREEQSS